MRRARQLLVGESGNVLFFAAVGILTIGALTILAVDISKLLVTRAQLQNSADGGALAGAAEFLKSPIPVQPLIEAHARDVAKANGAYTNTSKTYDNVSDVTATADANPASATYGTVTVISRSVVSQYFTGIVSLGKAGNVAAIAAARAGEVCRVSCMKPWTIPDLWDDVTLVPGYPKWRNNKAYDFESFTDLNGDRLWEPGEPYVDAGTPPDGKWTSEFYHPIITGYTASKNLGQLVTLKADGPNDRPEPGQYYPVTLPIPDSPLTGADRYNENIVGCNPANVGPGDELTLEPGNMVGPTRSGLTDLIDQDPGAYWDSGCMCVKGSKFGNKSPRIAFIPIHDPRIPISSGRKTIMVVKVAAFFIENVDGKSRVSGRFMKVQAPGELCPPGVQGAGYVFNIALIK